MKLYGHIYLILQEEGGDGEKFMDFEIENFP